MGLRSRGGGALTFGGGYSNVLLLMAFSRLIPLHCSLCYAHWRNVGHNGVCPLCELFIGTRVIWEVSDAVVSVKRLCIQFTSLNLCAVCIGAEVWKRFMPFMKPVRLNASKKNALGLCYPDPITPASAYQEEVGRSTSSTFPSLTVIIFPLSCPSPRVSVTVEARSYKPSRRCHARSENNMHEALSNETPNMQIPS